MFDDNIGPLEGDMNIPNSNKRNQSAQPGSPDFNTLDEPIKETIVNNLIEIIIFIYFII